MKETTLGLIETYGLVGAIEALDTAAKVSDVRLLSCEVVKGGIVTIIITGDVASVKAAVDASSIAVEKLGVLRNTHVIARAYDTVWNLLQKDSLEEKTEEIIEEKSEENKENKENEKNEFDVFLNENNMITPKIEEAQSTFVKDKKTINTFNDSSFYTHDDLNLLKVTELRSIARSIQNITLTKNQIKFGKKEELIKAILINNERRNDK